jgi:hypothetical protein
MRTRWLVIFFILVLSVFLISSCATSPGIREERVVVNQKVFFNAVESGDYDEVKRLVEAGADVNAKDNYGYTALMLATQQGHTEVIKLLIEAGADVGARDNQGRTACNMAFSYGNREIVQLLIPPGLQKGSNLALIHVHSGAIFEEIYDYFIRSCAYNFDIEGKDVGVGYEYFEESFHMWATVYVYPTKSGFASNELLRSHYQQVKNDVYTVNKNVQQMLEQENIFNFPSGDRFGMMAGFDIEMGNENMVSFLFLFGESEWFILFRISYPAAVHGEEGISNAIANLVSTFDYSTIE